MIEAKTLKPLWYDGKPTAVGSVINLTDSDFADLASIGRVERIETLDEPLAKPKKAAKAKDATE